MAHLQLPRSPCAEHERLVACTTAVSGAGGGAGGAGGGGGGERKNSLSGGGARAAALPLTMLKKGSCVKGRSRSVDNAFCPRAHATHAATSSACRVAPMPGALQALQGLLAHSSRSYHQINWLHGLLRRSLETDVIGALCISPVWQALAQLSHIKMLGNILIYTMELSKRLLYYSVQAARMYSIQLRHKA